MLLVYCKTKEEAEQLERDFDEQWPCVYGWAKGLRCDPITRRYYNPLTGLDY